VPYNLPIMTNSYKAKQSAGFTIVELIIIIMITILVSMTIVSYAAVTENAKKQTVKMEAQAVATLIDKYKSEKGSHPTRWMSLAWHESSGSNYEYYERAVILCVSILISPVLRIRRHIVFRRS